MTSTTSSPAFSRVAAFPRRHPVWTTLAVALVLLVLLFDWNWFRGPLERYVSQKTQRTFRISDLHVKLGLTPTIRLRDVYFSNADWSKEKDPMAVAKEVEFTVSLRDAWHGKILVPRLSMTEPDILLQRSGEDRRNWVLTEPKDDTSESNFRIGSLSVDNGRLRYLDQKMPFSIDIKASTFDPTAIAKSKDADAKPANNRYTTRFAFAGKYHDAGFSGNALTGDALSFQETGILFPLKGDLKAGTTKLEVEGSIADAANISAIDVQLHIAGQTLANLYPFLLLPLPASPPYDLKGRLKLEGNRYSIDDLDGHIGSSDIFGSGAYVQKEPRPLLTADLHSKQLTLTDLGPLVGVETKDSGGKPGTGQGATASRAKAKQAQKVDARSDRLLPAGTFEGSRLQKIDADIKLDARRIKVPIALPFESLRGSVRLQDGVLKLDPLDIGFAGGMIASRITLDARQPTLKADAAIDLRRIHIDQLVAPDSKVAKGAGLLGASLKLKGSGNSIADIAAKADGRVAAAISKGEVSNLLDAASGLNGGKVLSLLAGGDKNIAIRCGGVAFNVKNGQGKSDLFVVDTEQTQILGDGVFDLDHERFDMLITPKPKRMGILSLRTPVRLYGTFRNPDYELKKIPLIARVGGALALAALSPLAALLPLIETGPGEQTDCADVRAEVQGAQKQATAPVKKK